MDSQTKLKRVVIKQELVTLTGDYFKALILNQFLYWSERTKDYDRFLIEEKERYGFGPDANRSDFNVELSYGWIYKTANELNDELMLGVSANTIRRHLSKLVKAGYIDQRNNPSHKWDRTLQYRPNIVAIQTDLEAMGYALDGYPILGHATFNLKVGTSDLTNGTLPNEGAIPENTTENTTESPEKSSNDSKHSKTERDTLNELANQIAQVCGKINIATAHPDTRKELQRITLSLYGQNITPEDLKPFALWWYDNTWQGKKGQAPTVKQLGDNWGQFEAARIVTVPTIETSGDGGFYV
jgi:DNA-binding MarR family transcriptional regulator